MPDDAGVLQHHARAEFPVHALDKAHGAALRVDATHPDGVSRGGYVGPGQGFFGVDVGGQLGERGRGQKASGVGWQALGVGDDTVAHAKSAFGRLHQAVHMVKAFALRRAQALKQAQNHQG